MNIYKKTYLSRLKMDWKNLSDKWPRAQADFSKNKLKICGHPVMERWETSYMEKLAKIATMRGGIILEIGFGLGISASFIQQEQIKQHIIIESNKQVFARAKLFSRQAKIEVKLIFGFWQEKIKEVVDESISGILFDTYPLTVQEIHCNHFCFFKDAYRILKKGGIFTYYSDEEKYFSQTHLDCLYQAGFNHIFGQVFKVQPPAGCSYWQANTILAPLIIK